MDLYLCPPLYALMAWTGTALYFNNTSVNIKESSCLCYGLVQDLTSTGSRLELSNAVLRRQGHRDPLS